jgi:hypothetical protein
MMITQQPTSRAMVRRPPSPELSRLLARGKARLQELFARQPQHRAPVSLLGDPFGCALVEDITLVEDVDEAGEPVLRAVSPTNHARAAKMGDLEQVIRTIVLRQGARNDDARCLGCGLQVRLDDDFQLLDVRPMRVAHSACWAEAMQRHDPVVREVPEVFEALVAEARQCARSAEMAVDAGGEA